jgi:preprotein translocase subunit SecG
MLSILLSLVWFCFSRAFRVTTRIMETVLIVIHLMVVLALVAVVLLQRSEGGALGIGGGGGGGFMSGRGQANARTRAPTILGTLFFIISMSLTILANVNRAPTSVLDTVSPQAPIGSGQVPASGGQAPAGGSLFDQLQRQEQQAPQPPRP